MNKRLRCHGSGLTHSASRLYHFLGAIILWSQPCSFSLSTWKTLKEHTWNFLLKIFPAETGNQTWVNPPQTTTRAANKHSQGFARLNRAGTTASTLTGIPAKRWKLACASKNRIPVVSGIPYQGKIRCFSKARWTDSELHLSKTLRHERISKIYPPWD